MTEPFRTAVIGLGSMGYGIAQSCLAAGQTTHGFDVMAAQTERFQSEGIYDLDAPISGGSLKAAKGQLSIRTSGTPEAFNAAPSVLDATSETLFELGDSAGAGPAMKSVNRLLAGDYTPRSQINIWPKDLGIILDIAKSTGFSAAITAGALDQYKSAGDLGLWCEDDAAVAKVYTQNAGLTLPGDT